MTTRRGPHDGEAEERVDVQTRTFRILLLAFAVSACGSGEPAAPPGIFFPRVPIGDAYPAALMEGTLELHRGCLFVATPDDRWLLLWPEGYQARTVDGRIEVVDGAGEVVGREGEVVVLGGGETNPVEVGGASEAERWASELTGVDIPERCGDLFWLVSPN